MQPKRRERKGFSHAPRIKREITAKTENIVYIFRKFCYNLFMSETIHEGHRERLIKKFENYPDAFTDHELLELLLFLFIPRKDTNETAHKLIDAFGGLDKVVGASAEELATIEGVGERTAANIMLFGKVMERVAKIKTKEIQYFSVEQMREDMIGFFKDKREESFYMFLLDGKFCVVYRHEINGGGKDAVETDLSSAAKILNVKKCVYAIIVHNHPSGNPLPSDADDAATRKYALLCAMHGVKLAEHLIVGEDDVFSYYGSGRLEEIVRTLDV